MNIFIIFKSIRITANFKHFNLVCRYIFNLYINTYCETNR